MTKQPKQPKGQHMRMADQIVTKANTVARAYVGEAKAEGTSVERLCLLRGRISGLVIAAFTCEGTEFSNMQIDSNVEKMIHGARHGLPDQILD